VEVTKTFYSLRQLVAVVALAVFVGILLPSAGLDELRSQCGDVTISESDGDVARTKSDGPDDAAPLSAILTEQAIDLPLMFASGVAQCMPSRSLPDLTTCNLSIGPRGPPYSVVS
jgi:hypothetical protein